VSVPARGFIFSERLRNLSICIKAIRFVGTIVLAEFEFSTCHILPSFRA